MHRYTGVANRRKRLMLVRAKKKREGKTAYVVQPTYRNKK